MIHEKVVNAVSEKETANTREDGRRNRKSKTVIETIENGGQIEWARSVEGDQNLAVY